MKLKEKTMATLLIAIFMISSMSLVLPLTLAKGPLSGSLPNAAPISLSFTETAVSVILGDGTEGTGWTDHYPSTVGYPPYNIPEIDFIETGKAYHRADGMWFNVWLPQMTITGNSPMTISNGRFACWTEYISPFSKLLIRDQFRGQITIYETEEGWTMEGEYTQYSYFFGTDEVLEKYPNAVRIGDSDKWLLRTVVYVVTPYFPS